MSTLLYERNPARFAASRVLSSLRGSGSAAAIGPLRLVHDVTPELPGPGWRRVRPLLAGICGSDLATLDGRSSRYFEPLVSFPFVPGHEVVGVVEDHPDPGFGTAGGIEPGTRVVLEPVISCVPRGIDPPCEACLDGRTGGCERVAFGHVSPGLQIGFCADTGGGWSAAGLVAHEVQLHRVPEHLRDVDAVMVEPTACALHAVLQGGVGTEATVAVLGAGTLGLAAIAALRHLCNPKTVVAGAKYPEQQRLAAQLGADLVVTPGDLPGAVRRQTRSLRVARQLTGGADVVFDCVGSAASIEASLALVRPRGRVVLLGMPSNTRVDLTALWHRELALVGAYAYGTEHLGATPRSTFDLAMELVADAHLGDLVSARYPLERFEEALAHAGAAGRRGAVKVVFDLSAASRRDPGTGRDADDGRDTERNGMRPNRAAAGTGAGRSRR